jgi:homoserine kinase
VGGVSLARALVAGGQLLLDDESLFCLAADIEGHPDNVAPAFYGGFVISGREDEQWYAVPTGVDPRVAAVVFVPPTPLETKIARGLLPAVVSHADAAANSGRTALLVAALAGRPEHLLAATRDYLHQDQREPAMPESLMLMRSLRADGIPAVISGAGPTVLAFSSPGDTELVWLVRRPDGCATSSTSTPPACSSGSERARSVLVLASRCAVRRVDHVLHRTAAPPAPVRGDSRVRPSGRRGSSLMTRAAPFEPRRHN